MYYPSIAIHSSFIDISHWFLTITFIPSIYISCSLEKKIKYCILSKSKKCEILNSSLLCVSLITIMSLSLLLKYSTRHKSIGAISYPVHNSSVTNIVTVVNRKFSSDIKSKIYTEHDASKDGYDLVLRRTTAIVTNIAERMVSRVLHFHSETNLVEFFEDDKPLAVEGATDNESSIEMSKARKQYQDVQYVDFNKPVLFQFRPQSYEFVISIPPLSRNKLGPSITEMLRLMNDKGYGIIGAKESVWNQAQIRSQLKSLDESSKINFLSLQSILCEELPNQFTNYYIAVFRKMP